MQSKNVCTICRKDEWPTCGHLDGMPDKHSEESEPNVDDLGLDDSLSYRRRGRPKLPSDMKRREKLVISLTADELKRVMHAAADASDGPLRIQDWARSILLAASKEGG